MACNFYRDTLRRDFIKVLSNPHKATPHQYPDGFRDKMVCRILGGESVLIICSDTGVPEQNLHRWKLQTFIDAGLVDGIDSTETEPTPNHGTSNTKILRDLGNKGFISLRDLNNITTEFFRISTRHNKLFPSSAKRYRLMSTKPGALPYFSFGGVIFAVKLVGLRMIRKRMRARYLHITPMVSNWRPVKMAILDSRNGEP